MPDKNLGFVPGVIVFVSLIIFFGGILWLSGKNIILSEDYRYYLEFPDVVGLRDKAPVYMRGYRIGWTKDVEFEESFVRVSVDVKKRFRIPEDSSVEIMTLNFIGEKAITIKPGSSQQMLSPGATLQGTNKDLMTLATKILSTAQQKIEEGRLDEIIVRVTESTDEVLAAFRQMRSQMDKLDFAMYNRQIEKFGQASETFKEFMAAAQQDTRRITQVSRESLEKFNQTLENVDTALDTLSRLSYEVRQVARQINSGEGTIGELVQNKTFFANLNRTLDELNAFLADIKKNPKKYVRFSIF